MKQLFIFLFITLLTFQYYPQEINTMYKTDSIIKELKEKFAPDNRVAIFNIEAEKSEDQILIKGETNLSEAKLELIKKLNEANIKFKDQIEMLPSKYLGDKKFGVINLSVANIRSKPSDREELATQSILGTPIKVLKKGEDGYYLVQTPDGYIAWLDNDGFTSMNEAEFNSWNNSEKIIYLNEYGFSFSKPDANSQHVSDLVAGNLLKLIGEEGSFYKVNYPDQRVAFLKKDEAKLFKDWNNALNQTGETILKTAYRFIGIPYLWGGTSTKGMDCSGFTKTVYYLNGIILKRDASQQVNTGELVDTKNGWENLHAGDLLFFGKRATDNRKERITHVAIYIGDGDFIHSSGKVRINSLNKNKSYYSSYRDNMFIRAKRILTSVGKNGIERILGNNFYK
jgi:cell wall-associated NlpC family hydrolase